MKIFVIEKPNLRDNLDKYLDGQGEQIYLYRDTQKIEDYQEIITDQSEKILAIAPGLINWQISNDYLAKVKNLKGIAVKASWAGFVDQKFCQEHKIGVGNAPGANSQAVAEYAVWQMSSLLRKLKLQIEHNFTVKEIPIVEGEEVEGKTVGILGMGKIGQKIARIVKGMGAEVVYWNRSPKDLPYTSLELAKVLEQSDILFKTWEICEETKDLLNEANLKLLKRSAYFISVFGGIGWSGQDDYLLLDYAESGRIAGFSIENYHHNLAKVKAHYEGNIFIPAALAWHTKETHARYNRVWANTIINLIHT